MEDIIESGAEQDMASKIKLARTDTRSKLPDLQYGEPAFVDKEKLVIANSDGTDFVVNDYNRLINKPTIPTETLIAVPTSAPQGPIPYGAMWVEGEEGVENDPVERQEYFKQYVSFQQLYLPETATILEIAEALPVNSEFRIFVLSGETSVWPTSNGGEVRITKGRNDDAVTARFIDDSSKKAYIAGVVNNAVVPWQEVEESDRGASVYGYNTLTIPSASSTPIEKGAIVQANGVVYSALTGVTNPSTILASSARNDSFMAVPTISEAHRMHGSLISFNSNAVSQTSENKQDFFKIMDYSNGQSLYGLVMNGHELSTEETIVYNEITTLHNFFTTDVGIVKTKDYRGRFAAYQDDTTYLRTTPPDVTGTQEPANEIGALIGDGARRLYGKFGNVGFMDANAGQGNYSGIARAERTGDDGLLSSGCGTGNVLIDSAYTTPTTPTNRPDGVVIPIPLLMIVI